GAVAGQDLGLGVDGQAAHGVVDACSDLDGVVGRGVQGVGEAGAAKLLVHAGGHGRVPLVHGGGKGGGVHAHGLGQLLIGLAGHGVAVFDVALDDAGGVGHGLVDDQPAVAAGLGDLGGRDHVAGAHLVGEAVALGVDQDGAVAAQALSDQG